MELKNEALQNLWVRLLTCNSCYPKSVINLFIECGEAIEGGMAAIKAELTDANRYKDIYHGSADHLRNMVLEKGDELRKANNKISDLEEQLAQAKQRLTLLETSRAGWRSRAQHAEKRVMDLNKKISELEEENANLRETPFDTLEALKKENSELRNGNKALSAMCESRLSALFEARKNAEQYKKSFMEHYEENNRLREVIDEKEKEINSLKKKVHELEQETADDAIRIKSLERANSVLRSDNGILWSKLEEADILKRP